jgi:hypothetical protein
MIPRTIPISTVYFKNDIIKGTNASNPIASNDKSANPMNKNMYKNIDLLSETIWYGCFV